MPNDADLINLLPGLLRQAAIAKAQRPGQIDAATQQQAGGPPVQLPAPPQQPQGMPMSQSQFGGAPLTAQQQAMRQQALIQALRARSGGP